MLPKRTFDAADLLAIATMDYHAGRFADAQRGCKAALALRPDDPNAAYLLGLSEVQLGNIEPGLALAERAIAQDRGRIDRACELAAALSKVERFNDAIRVLGPTVTRAPDSAEAFRSLVATSFAAARRGASPGRPSTNAGVQDDRSVSVVVCSIDAQKTKRIRAHYETLFAGRRSEIILIDDARSLCEGYNRGFARCSGDVVIFSHDDIEIASPEFPTRLLRHLATNDLVGVAGTSHLDGATWNSAGWPRIHGCVAHSQHDASFIVHCFGPPPSGPVEALDGLFFAAKREVCEAIGFDAVTFDGFHLYDLDFSYRALLAGFRSAVASDILVVHASAGRLDAAWQDYARRFASKYRDKIVRIAPSPVSWPIVELSDRGQLLAFHRTLAAALGPPRAAQGT